MSVRTYKNDISTHQRQPPSNGTGLFLAKIKRQVFLVLVELPQVLALFGVHNSKHPCNRLSDSVADGTVNQ